MVTGSGVLYWILGDKLYQQLKSNLYRNFPKDVSPSEMTVVLAYFGIFLEVAAAIFIFSNVFFIREVGLLCSFVLHCYIFFTFPLGSVNEWNLMNLLASYSLFYHTIDEYPIEWYRNIFVEMDWILRCLLLYLIVIVPLIGNIEPEKFSFLLSYRYYAGNWEANFMILKSKVWREIFVPNLKDVSKFNANTLHFADTFETERKGNSLSWRLLSSLNGKSILHIIKLLMFKYGFGNNINAKDCLFLDCGFVMHNTVGWHFADGQNAADNFLYALKKRFGVEKLELGDVIWVHVNAIPLFSKKVKFYVFDSNGKQIICDEFDAYKEVHVKPYYE